MKEKNLIQNIKVHKEIQKIYSTDWVSGSLRFILNAFKGWKQGLDGQWGLSQTNCALNEVSAIHRWVPFAKLFHFSKAQFSHLQNGIIITYFITCEDAMDRYIENNGVFFTVVLVTQVTDLNTEHLKSTAISSCSVHIKILKFIIIR